MYKKILVPLDGSEISECSLPHVKAIALGCSVPEVILLRVVEPVFNPETEATARVARDLMAQVEEENKKRDSAYLNGHVEKLKAAGIHADAFLGYGKPADEILDFVEKHKVDLVIMSTHGRSGVTRWVMGSVAEKVIRHSPAPVLTVSPAERQSERRLLVRRLKREGRMVSGKSPSGYHLAKTVKIGGEGGWDYLIVDEVARRIYVSHATRAHVLNADTLAIIGEIPNTEGIHGIAFVTEFGKGYTSNGRTGTVTVFDLKTLKVLEQIPVGENPDSIRFDPFSKKVFTFNGRSHDSSVIDCATGKVVATIPLGGKVEFAQTDGKGRVYVNNEDKSEVDVIDSKTLKLIAQWPIAPGESPTGLALDNKNHRLFSVTRNKFMVVLDANDGKILASLPIGAGCDGAWFDPETQFAFASNGGDGTLTVVHEESPAVFNVLDTVPTKRGSRTMTGDLKTHAVFLPGADFAPTPAPTAEQPRPRPVVVPDTFVLMQFTR